MEKLLKAKTYLESYDSFYRKVYVKNDCLFVDFKKDSKNAQLDYKICYGLATAENLKELTEFVDALGSETVGSLKHLITLAEKSSCRARNGVILADWVYGYGRGTALCVSEGKLLYEWQFNLDYIDGSAGLLFGCATSGKLKKLSPIFSLFEVHFLGPLQQKITENFREFQS